MSLCRELEAENLNYKQGKPTKTQKKRVTQGGSKVTSKVGITETKYTLSEMAVMAGMAETVQVLLLKQSKYVVNNVKVTFDVLQISKTKEQTKVMLLLIQEGEEGQFYCQSGLLIRTVLIYTGKDGKSSCWPTQIRIWRRLKTFGLAACPTVPRRTPL